MTTKVVFDIETNGLYDTATTIHCISVKVNDFNTKVFTSRPIKGSAGTIQEGLDIISTADLIIGHNIINYDLPVICKLYPTFTYKEVLDTLLLSKLTNPNLMITDSLRKSIPPKLIGSHSLLAWGMRLRKYKGDYGKQENAWDILTEEMVSYCRQDSEVTYSLYLKLLQKETPPEAIWLEQEFARIISRQEKYGVLFDVKKAQTLHIELLKEAEIAEAELIKVFKPLPTWYPKQYPKNPYKKDGNKTQVLLNQEALGCHYNEDLQWGYFEDLPFNPTSRQHIARWLQEVYCWKPKEFTEKGSIIINEEVLSVLEFPEGKILAHYFNVKKLIGQLAEGKNAWLKMVDSNNRIHGRVDTIGAVSRRCTHSNPNMAQVPSSRAYKGHECRELFCVPKGKKLVGCDASGLELRVFAHYLARYDKGTYGDVILNGDIHTFNQKSAGLPTRDMAKTFIYGTLYGAGDEKIGEIVQGTAEQGRVIKANFFKSVPAYKRLLENVKETVKKTKTLKALDGNPYFIRSSHSALNTLLQGAGALIMKYWNIECDRCFQEDMGWKPGIDYEQILSVHDEAQWEVSEDIADSFAEITQKCFHTITKKLNLRVQLDGEAKQGLNWAQTH